jgi:hypothetical protein
MDTPHLHSTCYQHKCTEYPAQTKHKDTAKRHRTCTQHAYTAHVHIKWTQHMSTAHVHVHSIRTCMALCTQHMHSTLYGTWSHSTQAQHTWNLTCYTVLINRACCTVHRHGTCYTAHIDSTCCTAHEHITRTYIRLEIFQPLGSCLANKTATIVISASLFLRVLHFFKSLISDNLMTEFIILQPRGFFPLLFIQVLGNVLLRTHAFLEIFCRPRTFFSWELFQKEFQQLNLLFFLELPPWARQAWWSVPAAAVAPSAIWLQIFFKQSCQKFFVASSMILILKF